MISPETRAQIRRYFYAERCKIVTIASETKGPSRCRAQRHRE